MTALLLPIFALLLSTSLLLMGNGLQGVLLPIRAVAENFSQLSIGIMGSTYYLGFAVGCLLGPRLVGRVGHIRTFTALVAVASAVPLLHGMFTQEVAWWLARSATGFCLAGLFVVIESWLSERSTRENRGFVFSVYTFINLAVVTVGQMMLTIGESTSLYLFALASVLVSVSAVPVALTSAAAPSPPANVNVRLAMLYRTSPVGVVGSFAVGLVNGAFWTLGPVFSAAGGGDTTAVAIFMSAAVISGALAQWPIGMLSDRFDRRWVIVGTSILATAAGLALVMSGVLETLVGQNAKLLTVLAYGATSLTLYAICAAHLYDFVDSDGHVEASSGLLLVFAGGAVIGPLIAASFMEWFGPSGLFRFTAIIHLLLGGFALYRMMQRASVSGEERTSFNASVVMAQSVTDISTGSVDEAATNPYPTETDDIPWRSPTR